MAIGNIAKSQLIRLYDSIYKTNDTNISLQYYKNIDNILIEKIDSFFLCYEKEVKKGRMDSGFVELNLFKNASNINSANFSFQENYGSYLVALGPCKECNNSVLGFTFYKGKLIVIVGFFSKSYKSKYKESLLFNSIVRQEMNVAVQQEIANVVPGSFKVQFGGKFQKLLTKSYLLE